MKFFYVYVLYCKFLCKWEKLIMKGLLNVEGVNYRNIEYFRYLIVGIVEK